MTLETFLAGLVPFILGYFVGEFRAKDKELQKAADISVLASFFAATKVGAMEKSTVISRVIEKYHPVFNSPDKASDVEAIQREIEAWGAGLADEGFPKPPEKKKVKAPSESGEKDDFLYFDADEPL